MKVTTVRSSYTDRPEVTDVHEGIFRLEFLADKGDNDSGVDYYDDAELEDGGKILILSRSVFNSILLTPDTTEAAD